MDLVKLIASQNMSGKMTSHSAQYSPSHLVPDSTVTTQVAGDLGWNMGEGTELPVRSVNSLILKALVSICQNLHPWFLTYHYLPLVIMSRSHLFSGAPAHQKLPSDALPLLSCSGFQISYFPSTIFPHQLQGVRQNP